MNIETIRQAATEFRNAIEKCQPFLGITFSDFPRGTCGDVTLLLGTFLIENELGYFQYQLGDYGERNKGTWSSHAWLQLDNLVVDITADQFEEINEKVIVQKFSKWHQKLDGKAQYLGDYRCYNSVGNLHRMYALIKGCI